MCVLYSIPPSNSNLIRRIVRLVAAHLPSHFHHDLKMELLSFSSIATSLNNIHNHKTLTITMRDFFLQLIKITIKNLNKKNTKKISAALKTTSLLKTISTNQNQKAAMQHHRPEDFFFALSKDETGLTSSF